MGELLRQELSASTSQREETALRPTPRVELSNQEQDTQHQDQVEQEGTRSEQEDSLHH